MLLLLMVQVSQLVEDRTYLNTQSATLSRSLREKESEWLAIRQQYATLHQAHINTQAKVSQVGEGVRVRHQALHQHTGQGESGGRGCQSQTPG